MSLKIHPLFEEFLYELKQDDGSWSAKRAWEEAGKPVVEEENPGVPKDILLLNCEIAQKDARIAELEAREAELLRIGKPSYWSVEMAKKEAYNAALEEAAKECDGIGALMPAVAIAARIRALRKP